MKALVAVLSLALFAAAHAASAGAANLNPPRVYTGIHPPGAKPSSFAPRPGNKRHVYGEPIQSSIFNRPRTKPNKLKSGNLRPGNPKSRLYP